MSIICIRQPSYLPNLGFFQRMMASDIFVFLDDTWYASHKWDNRNKIRTENDFLWLTVPLLRKTKDEFINAIQISYEKNWQKKHLRSIELNYSKTPYFQLYWPKLKSIIEKPHHKLLDLNIELIDWIKSELNINTKTIFSSQFQIHEKSSKKLLEICKQLPTSVYFSGKGGTNYLDEEIFTDEGIKIVYDTFEHPLYEQSHGNFIPNMSVIDLLFNEGKNSYQIIYNSIKNNLPK
jgi:hypothetical protein